MQTAGYHYESFWVQTLYQLLPDYQTLHHYKHFNIARYRAILSVHMNHLHTYSHLHQILLLCISHSFLSIGLACKLTRSHAAWILTERTNKGHSILAKFKGKRRTVGANYGVCWLHKGEQWNYQKGNKFPLHKNSCAFIKQISFWTVIKVNYWTLTVIDTV